METHPATRSNPGAVLVPGLTMDRAPPRASEALSSVPSIPQSPTPLEYTPVPEGGNPGDDPDPSDDGQFQDPQEDTPTPESSEITRAITLLADSLKSQTPKSEKAKAREPDTFDGSEAKKLIPFLFQCVLFFRSNPKQYASGTAQVNFALSFLRGTALQWFEPHIMDSELDETTPEFLTDWKSFSEELKLNFGVADPKGDAREDLETLRMKDNQRIVKYNTEFNRLSALLRWDNDVLAHRYYKGLPDRIKDQVALQGKPESLRDLRELAMSLDRRYWERQREKTRAEGGPSKQNNNASSTTSKTNSSTPSSSSVPKDKKDKKHESSSKPSKSSNSSTSAPKPDISGLLGKDGKLLPEERQRRIDKQLCLRCGKPGHIASDHKPSNAPAGRSATTAKPEEPKK